MPDNETLSAAAFFLVAACAALWQYFRKPPTPPPTSGTMVSTAIGLGWLEREQAERLLTTAERQAKAMESCAVSLAKLADEEAREMHDTVSQANRKIDQLMDAMRENEERLRGVEGMRTRRGRGRQG